MEAAKTQKNLKEMSYPTKKTFKKKRDWYYTSKDKLPNRISQTSSKRLKLTIQTYQMRNKELKNEAWTTSRGNIKSIFAS